jgi:membrane associated rhomboid family serine protease
MVAIHILRITLLRQWDTEIFFYFSMIPAKFWGDQSVSTLELVVPLFSHIFLHADWIHVGFNSIWLLALGTPVARRLPTPKFIAFFFACGVLGAFSHVLLYGPSMAPMIGASGAVSGLMGAAVRFALFVPGGYQMALRYGTGSGYVLPLSDRRVLSFSAVWIGLNLVLGLAGGIFTGQGQSVAWDVHIAGYLAGLVLFPLFDARKRPEGPRKKTGSHLRQVK